MDIHRATQDEKSFDSFHFGKRVSLIEPGDGDAVTTSGSPCRNAARTLESHVLKNVKIHGYCV